MTQQSKTTDFDMKILRVVGAGNGDLIPTERDADMNRLVQQGLVTRIVTYRLTDAGRAASPEAAEFERKHRG